MYIRLYGRVYGYDIEKNENDEYVIVGDQKLIGNFKKPLIIDATKQIVTRRWYDAELFGHEIFGDKYAFITGQHTRLLLPGDAVILSRTNEKVVVYGSGRKSFSYYQDGVLKRRPYIYSDGSLSFKAYKFVEEPIEENTDWMDDNLKYNYDCFYKLIKTYYPQAKDKYIYNEFKTWYEAKKDLIALFREHPQWNDKEKCIAIDLPINRNVDGSVVASAARELFQTMSAESPVFSRRTLAAYDRITDVASRSYNYKTDNNCIRFCETAYREIKEYLNAIDLNDDDMNINAKASRNINAIIKKFKLADRTEYNKASAKCFDAMALKPLQVKFVVSLNICDFVTMSHGNSWSSCHSFRNRGGWHAGCLSYANDDVTVITYGLDKNCPDNDYYKNDKIFRQLFMINKEHTEYVQSRMYPACNIYTDESVNASFNSILSEVGIDISDTPVRKESGRVISGEHYLNYPDYLNFCNACNRYGSNLSLIKIGAGVKSLVNGEWLRSTSSLTGEISQNQEIIIWSSNINKSEYLIENE